MLRVALEAVLEQKKEVQQAGAYALSKAGALRVTCLTWYAMVHSQHMDFCADQHCSLGAALVLMIARMWSQPPCVQPLDVAMQDIVLN